MNLIRIANSTRIFLFLLVLGIYGLMFNVYVPPSNGDDITYFHGALSIAAGAGFKEQGRWIIDWPPVQSALMATTMLLTGVREYYLAKIINGLAVFLALAMAHRVMVLENRSSPLLICALIAIFPTALVVGSAGQADFTFFAISMLFILLVAILRERRQLRWAIACGCVLGIASLTRWIGVVLGVILVYQAIEVAYKSEKKNFYASSMSAWFEIAASIIGASFFLAWKGWLHLCKQSGMRSVSNYEYLGSSIWNPPNPHELFVGFLNLLTQLENIVLTLSPNLSWWVSGLASLFLLLCTWGFVVRIREHGWRASDAYFLATLILLSVYAYKESRYGIPIAPFLLDYVFTGLRIFHKRVMFFFGRKDLSSLLLPRLFFTIWITGLMAMDFILIFRGDGESMGPACQFLLVDNRDYLRGYHCDLYDTCKQISREYPDAIVASDKFHKQLIRYYSGLETHFVGYAPNLEYKIFVEVSKDSLSNRANELTRNELDFPTSLEGRLSNPRRRGMVTLWDVDA
ncbi:MAG: hypothetical protein SGI77_19380 [Pirellulaceae bacterium]|nr:hypothetical protein [Pirellulaceae bacterium]